MDRLVTSGDPSHPSLNRQDAFFFIRDSSSMVYYSFSLLHQRSQRCSNEHEC